VIGVITTSYPRSADDSAGIFVHERVRALIREGQTVQVLAAGERSAGYLEEGVVTRIGAGGLFYTGGAPEALEDRQIRPRLRAWSQAIWFSWAMLRQIALHGVRWQAVESHWIVPCGLLAFAALPRLPHRAHIHGGDLHLLTRLPWGDSVARVFCRSRPELVFASAALRDGFRDLIGGDPEVFGARSRVEPAPFDTSLFFRCGDQERRRLQTALDLHRPTVLAAGRLVPIKGFDILITALGQIPPPTRPHLVIAGEGPESRCLARQARELGVSLRLPGLLGQGSLAEFMAAADLFVHPCRTLASGRSEGMPLVVREALACGRSVIASASGGLRELGDVEGLTLVEPDDATVLARTIERILAISG
jgi:teichuronic acid biosynthesis glycosyltransferase TuaC